jgi:hypothetical protein
METSEILRKEVRQGYQGYIPQEIYTFDNVNLDCYNKLKRIPSKITSFFKRENISEVYKAYYNHDLKEQQYIIVTTDNSQFMIVY